VGLQLPSRGPTMSTDTPPAPDFAAALQRPGELVLFGLTPPRATVGLERAQQIADATLQRINNLSLDALVLYDLDDESDRTTQTRPFQFSPTMDPALYAQDHLTEGLWPTVIYRSVGKYPPAELAAWMESAPPGQAAVLVGASSAGKPVRTSLADAQQLFRTRRPDMPLGAVAIPERHAARGDEHLRLLRKQAAGVTFFVTQVVYDVRAAKDLASDYAYACHEQGTAPARLIFTLSLCGSAKTLNFLRWLGVDVPRWVSNELTNAADPLGLSMLHALDTARDLRGFCDHLGLPCGFNVESVSNRRSEIEAAVHLARQVAFETRVGHP